MNVVSERRRDGRCRGRAGSPGVAVARLGDLDRDLLGVVSEQRVLSQTHLERLFPEVPIRTLRYRTHRLCRLGLLGRSRPYRERGSAPFHLWPTRRGDALVRGQPPPRGGERQQPNPLFIAHAAAVSELYVALATQRGEAGLKLRGFWREGEAREPFNARDGKRRALAPDALIALADERGRELSGFVELDMGSMSHRRLSQKADLYASYFAVGAWRERHRFCPALLFLTISEQRTVRFLGAVNVACEKHRRYDDERLVAGACAAAHNPGAALAGDCWLDRLLSRWMTLREVLEQARALYERELQEAAAYRRQREEQRRRLLSDTEALRAHLREHRRSLTPLLGQFDAAGRRALEMVIAAEEPMADAERRALAALAGMLGDHVLDLRLDHVAEPDATERRRVDDLIAHYRARQRERMSELVARYGELPVLRETHERLEEGELLDADELDQLAADAERRADGREEHQCLRRAYMGLREREARRLAREQGLLRRLAEPDEERLARVDRQLLQVCPRCQEIVYPPPQAETDPAVNATPAKTCHFCGGHQLVPFTETQA